MATDELTIDPEFAALLPDLSCIQLAQLESNLTNEGWRKEQAIILWANHDDIIVDGMNRYRLCRQLGIEYKTVARTFADREAVKEWILTNAYGQRNLTVEQESYCRGEVYNLRKRRHGGDRKSEESSGQNVHLKTSEQVAEQFGVDEKTVRRDAKFAEALDSIAEVGGADIKQAILSGAVKASKADVIKLAKADTKAQKRALKALDAGKAESIKEALKQAEPQPAKYDDVPSVAVAEVKDFDPSDWDMTPAKVDGHWSVAACIMEMRPAVAKWARLCPESELSDLAQLLRDFANQVEQGNWNER